MRNLFTPWRLKWYPRFILFAFALSFLVVAFSGSGASTLFGRLGGDYPAFYSAGRIIAEGDSDKLYNAKKQFAVQKGLIPGEKSGFLPFAFPSFWAAFYAPFSLVNYRFSYIIHTLLIIGVLLLTIWLLSPINTYIRKHYLLFLCLALTFCPMLVSIQVSQNTAFCLFLIILSWRAVLANQEWLAGMVLGLLLFKPQFAVPLIGLHLLSGRWRVAMGSIPVATILYGIGAFISGPFWVSDWWKYATWFTQIDAGINGNNAVCWLGFFQAILGPENQLSLIIGWGMTIITSALLALLWFLGGHRVNYTAQLGITMAALPLLPPHAMLYDAGLILITCFAMIDILKEKSLPYLGLIWLVSFGHLLSKVIGFSPLFLVTLFTLVLSVRILGPRAIGIGSSVMLSELCGRKLNLKYERKEKA